MRLFGYDWEGSVRCRYMVLKGDQVVSNMDIDSSVMKVSYYIEAKLSDVLTFIFSILL